MKLIKFNDDDLEMAFLFSDDDLKNENSNIILNI